MYVCPLDPVLAPRVPQHCSPVLPCMGKLVKWLWVQEQAAVALAVKLRLLQA
jgi:hypothetical protein